ncbi:hypothetical protein B0H16DRAFT_1730802 [Mycena metata]|uniref:Uncharacterized protein n=1 Tax=Mycena metata TaxID=1033252 RepID=A0AAD7I6Z5_9AGAR|nr:hypothetical protein B0H16DRAFT_1730802 [Mycena metata]
MPQMPPEDRKRGRPRKEIDQDFLADDATQMQRMNRFLDYILELEPLIDGFQHIQHPTLLQTAVNTKLDFLLPFREHGPSRVTHGVLEVLFIQDTRRPGLGCSSATSTTYVSAWDAECAKYTSPPEFFFCNPWAYSKRKSKRSESLVTEYWAAIHVPDCPNWEANTANGNYAFKSCYDFLKQTSPSRFQEIGPLAGFLLAGDFSYTGVVQSPTVDDVGEIIRGINTGGVKGLELLGLVRPREKGTGRAFKMASMVEVKAGFSKLQGFLDTKLTAAQKAHMIFDPIMSENSGCKLTRVVKAKMFVI